METTVTKKQKPVEPTHQEWDWFDLHVTKGMSQHQIAEDNGTDYDTVTESVRRVCVWLRRQYNNKNRYEILKSKQLYRLEILTIGLMKQFAEGSDVQAAREARMTIHEWMEITGGLEPKKIEQTSQSITFQINSNIDRILEANQPVNPKMLEAAQKVKSIENRIVEVSS